METQVKNQQTMTSEQQEFFSHFNRIIKEHYLGGSCSVEWNYTLNSIQVSHPTPHNNLAIDITMLDKTMGGGVSIDLVNLDADPNETDVLGFPDFDKYYIKGLEFDNTYRAALQSISYLLVLLPELN